MPTPGIWRQESFAGGELSPDLHGRNDTIKYATGLATCRNFMVKRSGAVETRPGTRYICETKNSGVVRLIDFIFNYSETYCLEFGDEYMRVVQRETQLTGEDFVTGTQNRGYTPIRVTRTSHGYSTGDTVEYGANSPYTPGGGPWTITLVNGNTFSLDGSTGADLDDAVQSRRLATAYQASSVDRTVAPYVVTCASHGYSTGDVVEFSATLVGTFTITSTGANTFTLNGTTTITTVITPTVRKAITAYVAAAQDRSVAPNVVTLAAHGYLTGESVELQTIGTYVIVSLGANTFSLTGTVADSATSESVYMRRTAYAGGGVPTAYEIVSPYTDLELSALQYAQSGDVLYIVHPDHVPKKLSRYGDTEWTFSDAAVIPVISAPTGLGTTAPGSTYTYVVTAIAASNHEESAASSEITSATQTSTITWTASTGALEYNIYKKLNGKLGYIGTAGTVSFLDSTILPDITASPPEIVDWLTSEGNPATVGFYQQRLVYGGMSVLPQSVRASRVGMYSNFTASFPLQDDDSISFSLVGRYVPAVKHVLEVGVLEVFTNTGEWIIKGDADGAVTPTIINARQQSYNGVGSLFPIVYDSTVIYQQARGSIIRDFDYNNDTQSYKGRDLTIFSSHLFEAKTLLSWDYAQTPNSIIWVCRSDGVLLGQTYLKEHEIYGWHRHDTALGLFEDVCSIPEDNVDTTYFVVNRTIDGSTKRYIESMTPAFVGTDVQESWQVDSGLAYNGRNLKFDGTTSAATLTVSGTTGHGTVGTLTASTTTFTSADVGNRYVLTSGAETLALEVTAYTSGTILSVRPAKDVSVLFSGIAISVWDRAIDEVSGLDHLEGATVSVLADGSVESQEVVSGGAITLGRPFSRILVGLPITCELVTLPLDRATRSVPTIVDKKINISTVDIQVKSSRGILAGSDLDHLADYPMRVDEIYGAPTALLTGKVTVQIDANWEDSGQIAISQTDPLPLTILSVSPGGKVG